MRERESDIYIYIYMEREGERKRDRGEEMDVNFKGKLERGKPGAVRLLNRIVTVTESGLEHEADQGHAEIIVSDIGLSPECKGVVTPGVSEKEEEGAEEAGVVDER